ncbi:MAG TPA: tetratricopeptide repeat protein [Planctomycetota bacterium]|nr:tetratricopeptide repeat protein [Planctomycetota bacterium]
MGNGLKWAASGVFALSLLASPSRASEDVCAVDLPSPFAAAPVHTESIGAKWRHGFHDMRVTWDKYFEVFPKEFDGYEQTSFEKVRAEPAFFLDRKIRFELYFGKSGTFYRPFTSPFNADAYVNFSAWGMGSELWTLEGRREIHPLFYVEKRNTKLIDKLAHLPMYTPIHVWGEVRSKTENLAWIELRNFEIIPEAVLNDAILRHMELANTQLNKKRFDLASRALEDALKLEIPVSVEVKAYSMLGRAYYEQRLYNKARYALVQSLLRDDRNVSNMILLARTDLRIDRAAEAKDAMLAAIKLEPSNPEAHAELGLALAMCGDVRGAYRELDIAQRLAPRGQLPEAHRNRAMVAMREGKLPLAKEELSKALLQRPLDYGLHLELGDVYLAMGALSDARTEYTQAKDLSIQRADPEPYYKIAVVLKAQGDALSKENKAEEAKKFYQEALENVRAAIGKDENFTPAYGLEAELLRLVGKPEDATKALLKGAEANPRSLAMQDVLYEHSLAVGDWQGMEQATRAALNIRATAKHASRLGNILSSRPEPDFKAAAAAYEQAVELNPNSAEDWAALARIRVQHLNDYTGGEVAAAQAVNLASTNGDSWYDLAVARQQLGNVEGAHAAADEASKLTKSITSRILLAHLKVNKGEFNTALELSTAAAGEATLDSDKAWAQSVQGAALLNTGKVEEAVEAFAQADDEMKGNPEHNLWYANALLRQGEFARAAEKFAAAAETGKSSGTGLGARVVADAQKGSKAVAKQAKAAGKSDSAIARSKPSETPSEEPTRKPMPPVVEETNGNGKNNEPMPAESPGPR